LRVLSLLLRLSIVTLLIGALYGAQLLNFQTKVFGDSGGGDPPLVLMQLKWSADFVMGRTPDYLRDLFAFPIYYPYQNSFSLSDNMLGNQWIWAPLYYLTDNPVIATNAWILLTHFLNVLAFALFIGHASLFDSIPRRKRVWIAFLGGLLFAFAGFRLDRHFHLQLFPQFWTPLGLLILDRACTTSRFRYFLLVPVVFSLQWLAGAYLGLMALLLAILAAWYYVAVGRTPFRLVLKLLVAFALIPLLLLPVFLKNLEAVQAGLRYDPELVTMYSAGLAGFLNTVQHNHFALGLGVIRPSHCSMAMFPGLAVSALMLVAGFWLVWRRPRNGVVWGCVAVTIGFLVLALGDRRLVEVLPFYSIVRVPGRFTLAALIPGLAVMALALHNLLSFQWIRPLVVAATLVVLVEAVFRVIPAQPYPLSSNPGFSRVLERNEMRPILFLPQTVGTPNNLRRVKISQAQMTLLSDSWVPGIAGRSGPRPPFVNSVNALSLQVLASPDAATRFVQRIRRLGFAAVVVIQTTDAEEYCSALSPVLGQPEQIAGRYSYFPLYGDPMQAPLPSSLDLGEQLVEAIRQQAYSVQVGRLDQNSFRVTVCPTDSLMGVVQRRQRIVVPYELTLPAGDTIHGTGIVTLDQVTDQPDLSFIVRMPYHVRR
jgi:hypothetical protein